MQDLIGCLGRRVLAVLLLGGLATAAHAGMVVRAVSWSLHGTTFHGDLVYDDAVRMRRPGLLMIPNWYGVNAQAVAKAKRIAGKDYVILLGDMYGAGVRPTTDDQARQATRPLYADRAEMRRRVDKALGVLRAQAATAPIDTARLAAIGFCFGGTAVLDLARSGVDIAAVVSFHGGLGTDDPSLARHIRARVLAMNGADDSYTMPDVPGFLQEMRGSPADWQLVVLGHAVHCFTEVGADSPGCRYDARAARRSYRLMHMWLRQAFASRPPAGIRPVSTQ